MTAKDFQALHGRGSTTTAPARPATDKSPKGKKPPTTTSKLTQAVIHLLQLRGFHVWRQNNAAIYDPTRQAFRANSSTPGISDVLGYCQRTGRMVAVEVKAGKDKLSKEQIDFLAGVRRAGGFASECRDVATLDKELQEYLSTLP